MTRADVAVEGRTLSAGKPLTLFDPRPLLSGGSNLSQTVYAVTRDGRFLVNTVVADNVDEPLTVVLNWRPTPAK